MQICVDYRPALHQSTGVGTYVRGLLYGLLETHPENSYTAFSASWKHRVELPAHLQGTRVVDVRFPVRLLDSLWHRHGWPPIEGWVGPHDVVHSPSPLPIPTRRAKQVVTVHDCYFLRRPDHVIGPMRRDYAPLLRKALERADGILTNTCTTRDELLELVGIAGDNVHVTPLGVDPVFEATLAPPPSHDLALPERYVLFVGRREPRKDPATLLAAFDRILERDPDLRLLMVGPEGHGWREVWAATTERVREATICLAHQPAERLAALYASATMLLLPSLWEGFGLTAIEAMAMGTPVVAARVGALPEVLGDAAVWVDPADAEALAAGCERLLASSTLRQKAIEAGHVRARLYRWSRTAELTNRVYARLRSQA